MEDRERRTDRIIIGVLIIIILLLLGLNACTLMKKDGEPDKGGTGNIAVFDFKCEKSCKKENNSGNNDSGSGNKGSNNKGSNKGNTGNNGSANTGNDEQRSGSDSEDEEETTYDMLEVYDDEYDTIKWNGATDLKIFENNYSANGTIAPESVGSYEFVVRNSTDYKLKYDLDFVESNASNINMKYKLKKNGTYLNNEYVSYADLALNGQVIEVGTKDTYILEWKWISTDNDTNIGKNGAEYSMKIVIDAEGIDG